MNQAIDDFQFIVRQIDLARPFGDAAHRGGPRLPARVRALAGRVSGRDGRVPRGGPRRLRGLDDAGAELRAAPGGGHGHVLNGPFVATPCFQYVKRQVAPIN